MATCKHIHCASSSHLFLVLVLPFTTPLELHTDLVSVITSSIPLFKALPNPLLFSPVKMEHLYLSSTSHLIALVYSNNYLRVRECVAQATSDARYLFNMN